MPCDQILPRQVNTASVSFCVPTSHCVRLGWVVGGCCCVSTVSVHRSGRGCQGGGMGPMDNETLGTLRASDHPPNDGAGGKIRSDGPSKGNRK